MSHALFHYFLNSAWQIPLLALCTALALQIARPVPRVQYLLWVATLLLAIALPLRGISFGSAVTVDTSDSVDFDGPLPPIAPPALHIPFVQVLVSPGLCNLLVGLYLGLTGLCAIRLIHGQLAVRRLVAASTPLLQETLGVPDLHPAYPLRVLPPSHGSPLVAGVLHPTVLLPQALLRASPNQLAAVFAHESAHIRRRDLLANLALRILSLPIAYHPATFYLHHRIRLTRELLVDALAASSFRSPGIYAGSLLSLASQLIHPNTRLHAHTAGLFQPPSRRILEERIMYLVAPPAPPRPFGRALRIAAGLALVSTAAATATLFHLTPTVLAAQQPAPAPPDAPPVPLPTATPPAPLPPEAQVAPAAPAPLPAVPPVPSVPPLAPLPALAPVPAVAPLSEAQRKQLEERIRAATEQIRDATAQLRIQINTSDLQKQIAEATRNPIDPATQAKLKQLSEQISKSAVNSPVFKRSMEDLRRQLESPEFKRQIQQATEQARKHAVTAEDQRRLAEEVRRRVESPEFKLQIEKIRQESMRLRLDALNTARLEAPLPPLAPVAIAPAAPAPLRIAPLVPAPDGPVRISGGVIAGLRESGTNPTYPPDAKAAGVSGSVVLHAIISKVGTIESLQIVSGPQELQQAAWDAVKTWVYKPYLLNGQPTAVETTITVNFSLAP